MKQRIVTGLIGGALFISMTLIGGSLFHLFIFLIAIIAMGELLNMNNVRPYSLPGVIGLLFMVVIFSPDDFIQNKLPFFILFVVILLILTVVTKNEFTFDKAGFVTLSALYVGYGFHLLITARDIPEYGMSLVFFFLFLIWTTDSGAYFVGRQFGKHKLWPSISPNKTVEGALGGIVAAIVVGSILYAFMSNAFSSYMEALFAIFLISVFGQLGDLVQSALKRHYGVKDSGKILPGHGGLLDRFDSLLFVMVILHLFQFI